MILGEEATFGSLSFRLVLLDPTTKYTHAAPPRAGAWAIEYRVECGRLFAQSSRPLLRVPLSAQLRQQRILYAMEELEQERTALLHRYCMFDLQLQECRRLPHCEGCRWSSWVRAARLT